MDLLGDTGVKIRAIYCKHFHFVGTTILANVVWKHLALRIIFEISREQLFHIDS